MRVSPGIPPLHGMNEEIDSSDKSNNSPQLINAYFQKWWTCQLSFLEMYCRRPVFVIMLYFCADWHGGSCHQTGVDDSAGVSLTCSCISGHRNNPEGLNLNVTSRLAVHWVDEARGMHVEEKNSFLPHYHTRNMELSVIITFYTTIRRATVLQRHSDNQMS